MDNPDFTLICPDGVRVPVNKAKLGSASEVFGNMFDMVQDNSEQECEISESSNQIKLLLITLECEGDCEFEVAKDIDTVVTLCLKYGLKGLIMGLKLALLKLIIKEQWKPQPADTPSSLLLFELATLLDDPTIAGQAICVTQHFEQDLRSANRVEQKWRQRALHFKDKRDLACYQLLNRCIMEETFRKLSQLSCGHNFWSTTLNHAASLLPSQPYKSPNNLLYIAQRSSIPEPTCMACMVIDKAVREILAAEWPKIEADLRVRF